MPHLSNHARLAADNRFRDRVQAAAIQAALQISGEASAPDKRSAVRQAYAGTVLSGSAGIGPLAWAVGANPTILDAYSVADRNPDVIPDGDIEYVMTTVWDDLSGASALAASE